MSTATADPDSEEKSELDEQVEAAEAAPKKQRKGTETLIKEIGLIVAPFLIGGLAVGTYFYYQNIDFDASLSQRSALEWSEKLVPQIQQHLTIAFFSTLIVVAVAIPLGILLTRPAMRRAAPYIISVANSGQALPAYGLLVLGIQIGGWLSIESRTVMAVFMLALYALLPVLRNTMVGLDAVDRNVIEAGRGMGLTKGQVLRKIELPLSVPVIMAGIRVALILNIGMATLAFLIGAGGLGITINSGIKLNENPVFIVGSLIVIIIALTADWVMALAERYLKPRGLT